jgi:hypothetical protein
MDAASFDALFQRYVVRPACAVGFEPWGKSLRYESHGLRAALLRTDLRYTWPFAFTFVAAHSFVRDFDDRLPFPWTREPNPYPVKLRPTATPALLDGYRYEPDHLKFWPQDEMVDGTVEAQLDQIGRALVTTGPELPSVLAPDIVLRQLIAGSRGAWAEERWIADYQGALDARRIRA